MSKGIKLSPKYGVNPTIPVCFFCGEDKNEIAMLGRIGDGRKGEDFEAPRAMCIDYEPCDKCKDAMSKGVTIISASNYTEDGRPPVSKDEYGNLVYPTGAWSVVKTEPAREVFNNENLQSGDSLCLDSSVYNRMFGNVAN